MRRRTHDPIPEETVPLPKPRASEHAPRGAFTSTSLAWLLLACCVVVWLVSVLHSRLPESLGPDAPADQFSGERAHAILRTLAELGPRPAGSKAEAHAAYLLSTMARTAGADDVELVSFDGAFPLQFLDGLSNVYRGVRSVVARLRPSPHRLRSALLLNCHYDTVPDSPGASDDAAGCAVLLEVLRALKAGGTPGALHDAVFLLNGAEENIMQAAHGFLQHRWAARVRTVINVEACGAGGRELVFRAAPPGTALRAYAKHAPRPFASALAHDIFRAGLLPAETDFRIFRDANVSGLDLAWSADGYVYHTALDAAGRVPAAALQRAGDNVLAVARALLTEPELPRRGDGDDFEPVFFDVLGAFTVVLGRNDCIIALVVIGGLVARRLKNNIREAASGVFRGSLCVLTGALTALAISLAMTLTGRQMLWFCRPLLLVPLYAAPAVGASGLVALHLWRRSRPSAGEVSVLACWAVGLGVCAAGGLRSSFVPALWSLCLAVPAGVSRRWMWARCAGLSLVPLLVTAGLVLAVLETLVPVSGRVGAEVPPDAVLGGLVGVSAVALAGWTLPVLLISWRPKPLLWSLVGCGVVTATLLTFVGFPYSAVCPQRYMMFHTRRTLHAHTDTVTDAFWIPQLDANTVTAVLDHVPALRAAYPMTECSSLLYCGAPYYLPALTLVPRARWLPAQTPPPLSILPSLRLDHTPDQRHALLNIQVNNASKHVVLIISPAKGAKVSSFDAPHSKPIEPQLGPLWNGRKTYFISLHDSRAPPISWRVSARLELEDPNAVVPSHWAAVSVAGHCLADDCQLGPEAVRLRQSFPSWTTLTGWSVDLHLFEV